MLTAGAIDLVGRDRWARRERPFGAPSGRALPPLPPC